MKCVVRMEESNLNDTMNTKGMKCRKRNEICAGRRTNKQGKE
jgi:hypothetical protein